MSFPFSEKSGVGSMNDTLKGVKGKMIILASMFLVVATTTLAHATPIRYTGTILNNTSYTFVHNGANGRAECSTCLLTYKLRIVGDRTFNFIFDDMTKTLTSDTQVYDLHGGARFTMESLSLEFDDPFSGGVYDLARGTMGYKLEVPDSHTKNYSGDRVFENTYEFRDLSSRTWNRGKEIAPDIFKVKLWGGDTDAYGKKQGLGIDFVFKGEKAPAPVPEPGTLILMGSGLAGILFFRRKIEKAIS